MTLIEWIIQCSENDLAEIWVELNCWRWPNAIPFEFRPYWWDIENGVYNPKYNALDRKIGFFALIMDYCKANVSDELLQKKWIQNTQRLI